MTEHVHEWEVIFCADNSFRRVRCAITNCFEQMSDAEIECRLNATERLSAGDAREIAMCVSKACVPQCECSHNLQAYANILEGK